MTLTPNKDQTIENLNNEAKFYAESINILERQNKNLQAEIKELKRQLSLVNDHAESCAIFVMDDKDCNCFYGKIEEVSDET